MSDISQGDDWWVASDGKWYAPEQHPDYVAPASPVKPTVKPAHAAETVAMAAPDTRATTPGPAFTPASPATEPFDGQLLSDPSYNLPAIQPDSSSKRSLILGIAAIVLIAGLGFLAFRFFTGGSAAGGAASPDAAIDQLIASVNERDAVGFIDIFDPDEIEAWIGSFEPALATFENIDDRGEATNDITEAYASIFDSFNYSLTGPRGEAVTYQLQPLDDDNRITRVRVDGLDFELMVADNDTAIIAAFGDTPSAFDISQIDGARAELRDSGAGLAARLLIPGESPVDEFGEGHIDLVTVQKDGKWFVSIGYTFLELARGQGEFDQYPDPDFGRAFDLVENKTGGSDSPEAVVQALFNSVETLDYETIIKLTDPYGTPYLHDYQPLIDSQVDEGERRDAVRDAGLRIDELTLGTSQWEGRTLVTLGDVSWTSAEGRLLVDTARWCATLDSDQVCAEDGIAELLREIDSDLDPRDFIPDETGIIVIERNGRWYLDPLGTIGYYMDQLAEVGVALTNEIQGDSASELGEFFLVEGPIARQGVPAGRQAESGSVGVALDVSGYPVLTSGFSEFHVAVARVVTDQPGSFVSYSDIPLDGEAWFVVYDSVESSPDMPAIAASTDGQLDVELFEATVTEVGPDGFTGQLGGQGRPQVFFFSPDSSDADIQITGANAQTVHPWASNGVVFDDPGLASGFLSPGAFVVVSGEPGATFSITVDVFQSEPEPERPELDPDPVPEPDPEPEDEDFALVDEFAMVDRFSSLVEPEGFAYSTEQPGGFFDGCGGPNDPDVTTYIYEEPGGALIVLTPYPTFDRAVAAFDQLINVASPCEAFAGIEVIEVVFIDANNIRIEWQLTDDPSSVVFEHYRFAGESIVVASDDTVAGLDDQIAVLADW